jgi:hypothetical protein
MQTTQVSVKEIIGALIERAKLYFPEIEITYEVVTVRLRQSDNYATLCRIVHHKIIDGKESWLSIVDLTTWWKSEDGYIETRFSSVNNALRDYVESVRHGMEIGLFKVEGLPPRTSVWVGKTKYALAE